MKKLPVPRQSIITRDAELTKTPKGRVNKGTGYLLYHPQRQVEAFGGTTVHFDKIGPRNQDPYVWNTQFLHSFCHITEMTPKEGDILFWVSRGKANPLKLLCDFVFIVESKTYWKTANRIGRNDPLVDSDEAWKDHYRWGER